MTTQIENKQWMIHWGLLSPLQLFPFSIRDRSGMSFTASLPGKFTTGANQEGVTLILTTTLNSSSAQVALEAINPILERVLNTISFRLLSVIVSRTLEIVEDRPITDRREMMVFPNYSPLGEGRFQWLGFSSQGGIEVSVDQNHTDRTDAAMRWFLQGLRGHTPIDCFAGYWLSIENLVKETDASPMQMRCCDAIVESCPACGASTIGPTGQKRRIRDLFLKVGMDHAYFKRIWELRNLVFHGSSQVFPRMMDIARESFQLRKIAIDLIKEEINIGPAQPPLQQVNGSIIGSMGLVGSYDPQTLE
ncbi:MAG: hypothetical protein HY879_03160 [Deltaproteobacteria bacterium]|nr:hypothetical protein [Deltaproteobacteria bacterium]